MHLKIRRLKSMFIGAAAVAIAAIAVVAALSTQPAAAQETVTVPVGDLFFCDASFQGGVCETTIDIGDTVVWDFGGAAAPHTTTACGASCDAPDAGALWDSGTISDGSTFQFTFTVDGAYSYLCTIHPSPMRGVITVLAAQEDPTATPEPATPPTPEGDQPADGPPAPTVIAPPATGQGPSGTADGSLPLNAIALAAAGLGLLGIAVAGRFARRAA